MSGSYAEIYRRAREALEQEAEAHLGRPLNGHERNLFRNCGTLTMLEQLGMTIYYAASPDELAAQLAATSLDGRFRLALSESIPRFAQLLGRPLTPADHYNLTHFGNIESLWQLEYGLAATPPAHREHFWRDALSTHPPERLR